MAKKRKQENLGPHPILMWGLVIVLLVALFFLINSSLFNVSTITVEGNIKVSHEEIIKLSGIDANTNIFHIDEVQAKQNIEQNGYLVVENIKRIFPSEVKIKVRERIAVAQIGTVNGYYVIDKEGIALGPLYTWQDERGNEPYKNTTYAKYLKSHTGYGCVTDFYNKEQQILCQWIQQFRL